MLALVGQAPLLANFIRASPKPLGAAAPKTPLKSKILLLYLRFWGIFSLRNSRFSGGYGVSFLEILEFHS